MQCQCSDRGNGAQRLVPFTHTPRPAPAITTDHDHVARSWKSPTGDLHSVAIVPLASLRPMGIDFHLISNFGALALITLAGPAVIFILYYRRGAL